MINPAGFDLPPIISGTTWDLTFVFTNQGVPFDLTDYSATLNITKSATDDDPVLTLSETSGLTLGGAAGTIVASVSASNTASLFIGVAHYTLELTKNGTTYRYLEGSIPIRR